MSKRERECWIFTSFLCIARDSWLYPCHADTICVITGQIVMGTWQCLYPILPMQCTASEPQEILEAIQYPLSHYDFLSHPPFHSIDSFFFFGMGIIWWCLYFRVLSDDVHTDCSVLRSTIFLAEAYLGTSLCPLYCYTMSIRVTIRLTRQELPGLETFDLGH